MNHSNMRNVTISWHRAPVQFSSIKTAPMFLMGNVNKYQVVISETRATIGYGQWNYSANRKNYMFMKDGKYWKFSVWRKRLFSDSINIALRTSSIQLPSQIFNFSLWFQMYLIWKAKNIFFILNTTQNRLLQIWGDGNYTSVVLCCSIIRRDNSYTLSLQEKGNKIMSLCCHKAMLKRHQHFACLSCS